MEALMFNLANLSDAELGALVRKSVGDLVMKQALEGLAEREAAKEAALVERQRLARDENRRRRSLITQPAFKVRGVRFAPLNVQETQWDEVMPKGIATKYMRLLQWTFGIEFDDEDGDAYEVVTWRVAYGIHSSWTSPDGVAIKRFTALKKALKCGDKEALSALAGVTSEREPAKNKAYGYFMAGVARTL
jgi:hypothetical protein